MWAIYQHASIRFAFNPVHESRTRQPAAKTPLLSTHRSFRFQIRSPHGNANGYTSMETCLLFALYLLRIVGPLGQLWNALASAPRAMNELLNWRLSFRAAMETYLLFALYLLRNIGSLGQLWNAPALPPRAMNELLNWGLSSRFFSFVCIPS